MAQDDITYKMVVIGGSAGSLDVVLKIVSGLPAQTKASFIIVLHRKSDSESILTNLLSIRTRLKVKEVEDKDEIHPGTIYLAPPDYHLLLEDEKNFSLDSSEKVHYSRPSIDVTFESVAETFGRRAIGILLSGANSDGAIGLKQLRESGGLTIAQDPKTAEVDFMPRQAIACNAAVQTLSPAGMIELLKIELAK
ncbi:MAG: chemotaxis protein CheB [Chitinophagaceae bacterium]|nr:MAG: chemotaxis protein CheB [Chitinophagaceae bacterium]